MALSNQFIICIPGRPPPLHQKQDLPIWDTCKRTSSTWSNHRLARGRFNYYLFHAYRTLSQAYHEYVLSDAGRKLTPESTCTDSQFMDCLPHPDSRPLVQARRFALLLSPTACCCRDNKFRFAKNSILALICGLWFGLGSEFGSQGRA